MGYDAKQGIGRYFNDAVDVINYFYPMTQVMS